MDFRVLLACLGGLVTLCIYRFYSYWATGFFVSDEYGYYYDAIHGTFYSDRWFFGYVNIIIFRIFGINSPDPFSYFLPFYMFFWAAVTFVVFYKILKLLGFRQPVIALSLASCLALISFMLLSLGFLTEPMGLGLAMVGVYFLLRFGKSPSPKYGLLFSVLAASFFGFAAGTREPYNAFLIGGLLIVLLVSIGRIRSKTKGAPRSRALWGCSVLIFVLLTIFFLFVPTHAFSQQVQPIGSQLITSVVSNPQTNPGTTVSTVTRTVTRTLEVVGIVNGTTTTATETVTNTTTTTTTIQQPVPFYRQFVVTNTLLIFFGGILLGWGPVCVGIAAAGLFVLLRKSIREKELTARFALGMAIIALGSYFVVSFIYAPLPYYFSFAYYSTVIRFSDTALPAYFLVAPFALAIIAKRRARVLGLAVVVIIFLIAAVPVYETYAASNLTSLGSSNPFNLSYHTPGAEVRDYFQANPASSPVYVAGLPYGWVFCPGVQDLKFVNAYDFVNNGQAPFLNSSIFVSEHWTSLFLYSTSPSDPAESLPSFLAVPLENPSNSTYSYSFSNAQTVASDSDFALVHVTVTWR